MIIEARAEEQALAGIAEPSRKSLVEFGETCFQRRFGRHKILSQRRIPPVDDHGLEYPVDQRLLRRKVAVKQRLCDSERLGEFSCRSPEPAFGKELTCGLDDARLARSARRALPLRRF